MPNFHIASITLYNQESGLNAPTTSSSSTISPSTISLSSTSNPLIPHYTASPSAGLTVTGTKFSGGGSGGGSLTTRTGHHHKSYQQGLNNRANELHVVGNTNDNDNIDNPIEDLKVIAKEDFFA